MNKLDRIIGITGFMCLIIIFVGMKFYVSTGTGYFTNNTAEFLVAMSAPFFGIFIGFAILRLIFFPHD